MPTATTLLHGFLLLLMLSLASAIGDKTGVFGCPDFVPDDGSGHSHNHDGDPIPAANVARVCVDGARCCYRKHCPWGVCVGFCLRRPHQPYLITSTCPAWTDGTDAWYVQGVFTGLQGPQNNAPRRPPPKSPNRSPPKAHKPPQTPTSGSCPEVYHPSATGGGPTDALYTAGQASTKCTLKSRCCYYLHCPGNACIFCLYNPRGNAPFAPCPPYDGRSNLYNVPGIKQTAT